MLKSLKIQNYVLIENLEIDFFDGFSTITGETGAGKSILLGALSLILGSRADAESVFNKDKKCVVEASFDISGLNIKSFFEENNLDFDNHTILRREISPNTKSRAFINDTPVNLKELRDLGVMLIDIHSQHQNLDLGSHAFQMRLLDSFAGNEKLLSEYGLQFQNYSSLKEEIAGLRENLAKMMADRDYISFQFEQLESANLVSNELEELENEQEILSNTGEILAALNSASEELISNDGNVVERLRGIKNQLSRISSYYKPAEDFVARLESSIIELKDLGNEAESAASELEINPGRLEEINERLDLLYTLLRKHNLENIDSLIELKNSLEAKLLETTMGDTKIEKLENELAIIEESLFEKAEKLNNARLKSIPDLEEKISFYLKNLAIKNAVFKIELTKQEKLGKTGINTAGFMFSANSSVPAQEIGKAASGGELSRLMLSIKLILAGSLSLPTIIFDEIDTGVSGEIGEKMGKMMKEMSLQNQIISITHLPQIASKGNKHYLVFKENESNKTETKIKLLKEEERLFEIAKMLSGEKTTDAAIENARVLLAGQN